MTSRKISNHKLDSLLMIPQFTWQCLVPKIIKYFSLISTPSSTGNEPGKWNSIQANAKSSVSHSPRSPLSQGTTCMVSVDSAKYLGVTISKDLSWNSHIENITVSTNRTLGFVKRNIKTKNQEIRTTAYNTLVRPQVEYPSAVWSPYTKENINKIEMLQRRAARWVCNDYSPYSSVTDMLSNLGWLSLELRRYDSHVMVYHDVL